MTIITPKADAVRAHADNVELAGVDFLDVNDRVGARGPGHHAVAFACVDVEDDPVRQADESFTRHREALVRAFEAVLIGGQPVSRANDPRYQIPGAR